jgi:glycosyltransferase involved in cell wall biosynthesis
MPTISITTIVKNEVHNIDAFLQSIEKVADELVIVDTGSTDGTREALHKRAAASSFPIRIFELRLEPFHYGKAKNYAIARATGDYVLIIDADERVMPGLAAQVRDFLNREKPTAATILRIDDLLPHLKDAPQLRLFRTTAGLAYDSDEQAELSPIHERFSQPVPIAHLNEAIIHMQGSNHWLRRPSRIRPQLAIEVACTPNTGGFLRECARGILSFYYKFRKVYIVQETWKDGWNGFRYAVLKARYYFLFHLLVGLKPRVTVQDKTDRQK